MQQLDLPLGLPTITPLWRPIHYLGSKLRLVESIERHVSELDPSSGRICDLFAGSGTVALALSGKRNVVAADIQEYSRVLCAALLQPAIMDKTTVELLLSRASRTYGVLAELLAPILEVEQRALEMAATRPTLLCELAEHGSLLTSRTGNDEVSNALRETNARIEKQSVQLTTTRYFGGIYFSYKQTIYIDSLLEAIDQLPPTVRDTCLAAVLSTASQIVNSVGKQFAQPMRPRRKDGTIKTHLVRQMCQDRWLDTAVIFPEWLSRYRQLPQSQGHKVVCGDFRDILRKLNNVSLVYADPPYTRDHYSRFYHVLETISLRDSPTVSTTSLTGKGKKAAGFIGNIGISHRFASNRRLLWHSTLFSEDVANLMRRYFYHIRHISRMVIQDS